MKKTSIHMILLFLLASGAGVLLHFLWDWFPNPVVALFSPVRESLWEHVKLLYYPLLAVALWQGRGKGGSRPAWLVSLLVVCLGELGASYLYHVVLRGDKLVFDLALYFVFMALGFLLPKVLWPLSEWPGTERAAAVLTGLLGALIICFTFFPPSGALFADLSGELRTFLTIPV